MSRNPAVPDERDWQRRHTDEDGEAEYFARRYGLPPDQLNLRARLEAAARRVID